MQVSLPVDFTSPSLQPDRVNEASDSYSPAEIEQVGQQFEGVFLSMLIKVMRDTLEDGLFPGENSDTYGGLFDMYLGQHMAQSRGLGLKQMLVARYAEAESDPDAVPNPLSGSTQS